MLTCIRRSLKRFFPACPHLPLELSGQEQDALKTNWLTRSRILQESLPLADILRNLHLCKDVHLPKGQ
jgi:hypothetical protein